MSPQWNVSPNWSSVSHICEYSGGTRVTDITNQFVLRLDLDQDFISFNCAALRHKTRNEETLMQQKPSCVGAMLQANASAFKSLRDCKR